MEVSGIYAGRYVAKVRAINALDIGSLYSESIETVLNGKTTLPPTVAALTTESLVFAIKVKWQIPQGVSTADLQRTEIWYGKTAELALATKLGDYAYPQTDVTLMGLGAGTSLFSGHAWWTVPAISGRGSRPVPASTGRPVQMRRRFWI